MKNQPSISALQSMLDRKASLAQQIESSSDIDNERLHVAQAAIEARKKLSMEIGA